MKTRKLWFCAVLLGITTLLASGADSQPPTPPSSPATPKSSADAAPAKKKQTSGPFHGKLAALDKAAGTITVGKRTFKVVSTTKITKGTGPATLNDGVIGEPASGYFKTGADGQMTLVSLRFGPKPGTEPGKKAAPRKQGGQG